MLEIPLRQGTQVSEGIVFFSKFWDQRPGGQEMRKRKEVSARRKIFVASLRDERNALWVGN